MQTDSKSITRVNFIGFFSLTIEKIDLILLTSEIFKFKVNVLCRINLVFSVLLVL
jgi:hypothetical protein